MGWQSIEKNIDMKTLWTFGDSFTFGHGCREDCPSLLYSMYKECKSPLDDIWTNQLANLLEMNVKNLGNNGNTNDTIIDSIIDSYDFIDIDDIVIIGKTYSGRHSIPYGDTFHRVMSIKESEGYELLRNLSDFDKEISETIINFQYYFANHSFYKEQQDKRIQFLSNRLYSEKKIKKCIIWDIETRPRFETILEDTKGRIKDYHFSWKGHRQFTKYLYSQIQSNII